MRTESNGFGKDISKKFRSKRAEKRGLRGGLEGGENSSGLGDLKLGSDEE